jgi:transposase
MIKEDKKKMSNGTVKTYIRVVEGYRPGPGLPTKQRTIKSFGYLEDQDNQESFMEMVKEFDANYKKDDVPLRIEVPSNAKMYSESNRRQNYGYKFLEYIYEQLDIKGFIRKYEKSHRFKREYSLADIFEFLVLMRILSPDSKRATSQMKDNFYGMRTDFSLTDIYRSLSHYADFEIELQRHLNDKVKELIGRDLSYAFYDVTNYFFDIDFPDEDDGLRKRGVSKEHRVDPIVAMGLFIDSNGLPISMSLFPGNTSDSVTLSPVMKDVKDTYELGRLVVVADKGLNSTKNIDEIVNNGDGYVVSQILRGKKGQRYHEALFDKTGYIENKDGTYRHKIFTEEYIGKNKDGEKVTRKRKVLIYWSKADADMARRKREEKLKKAERSVKNSAYGIKKGIDEYTKESIADKETGEVLENVKKFRSVDMEKAENDALYDGYFCIITSELNYDERKIREVYSGLWRIEQSFRIMKSDLYARPVFVSKDEHIRAHFLICFTALLIIRIIQHRMGKNPLSTERIARTLSAATCEVLKGGIIHLHDVGGAVAFQTGLNSKGESVETLAYSNNDEIALDYKRIQDSFGTKFYDIYPRQEVFNKFLKSIGRA